VLPVVLLPPRLPVLLHLPPRLLVEPPLWVVLPVPLPVPLPVLPRLLPKLK
jgi:hypothetical protein